jgi:hypothetical protein
MADNAEGRKPPANEVEPRRKESLKEINRIDNWTNAAADNGLFVKQKSTRYCFSRYSKQNQGSKQVEK